MRHFAEVDGNNVVINVALFEDDCTPADLGWSGWYETADNIPKNMAGPGYTLYTFVSEKVGSPTALFYPPCPLKGWVLDANHEWGPPADKPYPEGFGEEGNTWWWDEAIEDWDQKGS